MALNPRLPTIRPDNKKRDKKIEKRYRSRAGMRNGEAVMGLSLKSQFISETRLHLPLTLCNVPGLLINFSSFAYMSITGFVLLQPRVSPKSVLQHCVITDIYNFVSNSSRKG